MKTYPWQDLLTQWNRELWEWSERITYSPEVEATGWLGYPGASEAQIAAAESRLGVMFPPSYRQFLQVTNGWRQLSVFTYNLWSVEEIDWLRVRNQELIDIWMENPGPPVPDADYLVYEQYQWSVEEIDRMRVRNQELIDI